MKLKRFFFIGILFVVTMGCKADIKKDDKEIFSDSLFLNWVSSQYGELWTFADKSDAVKYGLYGTYCIDRGDYDKAIKYCNKAWKLDQDFPNRQLYAMIYSSLSVAYMQKQDYDNAIENCYRALDFCQDDKARANIFMNLAMMYIRIQNYDLAVESTQESIKLNENDAMAYGSLSFYLMFKKQFTEAEAAARKGLLLDESQTWIRLNLTSALLLQGRYDEAVKNLGESTNIEKEMLLDDFEKYEKAGIIPEDRKADAEKFKELLKLRILKK